MKILKSNHVLQIASMLMTCAFFLNACTEGPLDDNGYDEDEQEVLNVTFVMEGVTESSVRFSGIVDGKTRKLEVGIVYSLNKDMSGYKKATFKPEFVGGGKTFSFEVVGLQYNSTYYYKTFYSRNGVKGESQVQTFTTAAFEFEAPTDAMELSAGGSANSYIISEPGTYSFKINKGNSEQVLGSGTSAPGYASLLWTSFGTSVAPEEEDLIVECGYDGGYVYVVTNQEFKEGNAVVALHDQKGNIMWSWHLWFTDAPQEQVYNNGAGTMMDRNLGATAVEAGEVGSLGLLYQWGRKDPFPGSSSISSQVVAAASTSVGHDFETTPVTAATGTVSYATENPMALLVTDDTGNVDKNTPPTVTDWVYVRNNALWGPEKTVYDPCPPGWRVPDGGLDGIWNNGLAEFQEGQAIPVPPILEGKYCRDFSDLFGDGSTKILYPACGYSDFAEGALGYVGFTISYWSCTVVGDEAYVFNNDASSSMVYYHCSPGFRACANSVRCMRDDAKTE